MGSKIAAGAGRALEQHMKGIIALTIFSSLFFTPPLLAQPREYPRAKVSFEDFKSLVASVESHRASRLVNFDTFQRMSREPGTIILDTRSTFRFERLHLKGARHLSFTDFTQSNLANLIPDPSTRILIYCNNNFEGNEVDFASKIALPRRPVFESAPGSRISPAAQLKEQARPLMMALNVPTYINLFGYGYHEVYELDELLDVNDPRITFEGTLVAKSGS